MNEQARPHIAVINVQCEIHSLLDTGECSGKVVNAKKLAEYGLAPSQLYSISGYNLEDCMQKLKNKLEKFNEHDE